MKLGNTFDGGTNGVGLTTGNSGGSSGTAFTAVESALTFSNEWAHSGSLSVKLPSGAVSGYGRWQTSGDRNVQVKLRLFQTAAQTGDLGLYRAALTTTTSTSIAYVMITPANKLRLRHTASGSNVWTGTIDIPTNTDVRIEALIEQGTGASDGRIRIAWFIGNSNTAQEDSGWLDTLPLRGNEGQIAQHYVAKLGAGATVGSVYMDDPVVWTGTDYTGTWFGGDVTPLLPPTVTVTSKRPTAGLSDGWIKLSWTAVTGATAGYEVSLEEGTLTEGFSGTVTEELEHTFSGLHDGSYTWAVRGLRA